MSASNWAICPRCVRKAAANLKNVRAALLNSYGTIKAEEYEQALATIKDIDPEDFRTFRENYAFYGAEDGVVKADYSGYCAECGLMLGFTDEHPLPL